MKNKVLVFLLSLLLFLILFFKINISVDKETNNDVKEYLHIVTTNYSNGKDDENGIYSTFYLYSVEDKEMILLSEIPIESSYPVAYANLKNNKIYFSNSDDYFSPDNLYEYNIETKDVKQLTNGKFLFNELFMIDDENIITNVAREYKTVTQPAIYNIKNNQFHYLNPEDDDTWFFSLSYNKNTNKFLCLTTSDFAMRTKKITTETHIRPKSLFLMEENFTKFETIYYTDEFEIISARQFDENRIMMITQPKMNAEPRKLKVLNLENIGLIDKEEIEDFDIKQMKRIDSFYPRINKESVFVLGKDINDNYGLYSYDINKNELTNIFEYYDLPENHRSIVDFTYDIS